MRSRDVRATTAGVLLIAATATSLMATAFLGSVLDGPGFLATVSLHQDRALTAALFQLIAAFTCAAIAVALYPVLRQQAAGMALGAVAFRLIEGVFYAVSAAGTMILVSLPGQLTANLGPGRHGSGSRLRPAGPVPAHRRAVQHAGRAQPPPRRPGDGPGGMADREGVQPDRKADGAGAGGTASSLRQHAPTGRSGRPPTV